jgi:hypothetical protein
MPWRAAQPAAPLRVRWITKLQTTLSLPGVLFSAEVLQFVASARLASPIHVEGGNA